MDFLEKFFEQVAEKTVEEGDTLWIRECRAGILEYAIPKLLQWQDDKDIEEIRVAIIDGGGIVWDALALYSTLRSLDKPTTAIVYHAHSAGVLVALGCDRRIGFPSTTVLIHDVYWEHSGRGDYLEDNTEGLRMIRNIISEILIERTNLTRKMIDRNARKEWWMSAEEALDAGILTEIAEQGSDE